MRLIDADALIKELVRMKESCVDVGLAVGITHAIFTVDEQPTAYDVEKVVAGIKKQFGCKDCEYADVFPTPMVCSLEGAELEVINDICDIVKAGGVE